jgi:hypothetical protein
MQKRGYFEPWMLQTYHNQMLDRALIASWVVTTYVALTRVYIVGYLHKLLNEFFPLGQSGGGRRLDRALLYVATSG